MYHSSVDGATELLRKKLTSFNHDTHMLVVLYKSQAYSVHSISLVEIILYPLSTIVYEAGDTKMYRDYKAQLAVKSSANDPEYLNVLDQAIENKPVEFQYVQIQNPRYSKYQKYFIAQLTGSYLLEEGQSI